MNTSELTERFLEFEQIGTPAGEPADFRAAAGQIVKLLLEDEPLAKAPIFEASVHRSRRSRIWVATHTGPAGGRVWKTTGLTDYDQALRLARRWEAEARAQRGKLGRTTGRMSTRVRRAQGGTGTGPLTQKEVAQILKMSERGVREIERRALEKLRSHPLLRDIWRQYLSGGLDEDCRALALAEIQALFDVAGNLQELRLIEKAVRMITDNTPLWASLSHRPRSAAMKRDPA